MSQKTKKKTTPKQTPLNVATNAQSTSCLSSISLSYKLKNTFRQHIVDINVLIYSAFKSFIMGSGDNQDIKWKKQKKLGL